MQTTVPRLNQLACPSRSPPQINGNPAGSFMFPSSTTAPPALNANLQRRLSGSVTMTAPMGSQLGAPSARHSNVMAAGQAGVSNSTPRTVIAAGQTGVSNSTPRAAIGTISPNVPTYSAPVAVTNPVSPLAQGTTSPRFPPASAFSSPQAKGQNYNHILGCLQKLQSYPSITPPRMVKASSAPRILPAPMSVRRASEYNGRSSTNDLKAAGMSQARAVASAPAVFDMIDRRRNGCISKLDLVKAVSQQPEVCRFIFPDIDGTKALQDEETFELVNSMFKRISSRNRTLSKQEFSDFYRKMAQGSTAEDLRGAVTHAFELMDTDGDGTVSKLELVNAVQREPVLFQLFFPGMEHSYAVSNSKAFDAIDDMFNKIAVGKKRIHPDDLVDYLSKAAREPLLLSPQKVQKVGACTDLDRTKYRLLIIGPGFGQMVNPRQYKMLEAAGFHLDWCHVPNPEQAGFPVHQHLPTIVAAIEKYQPHLLASASKGGLYTIELWKLGYWKGPTLMMNVHPSLKELPKNVPIVIAHSMGDELYIHKKSALEDLIATGSPNMCFLYTTIDSGKLGGVCIRPADAHNMQSLLTFDCLPRLVDCALSRAPEYQMVWSWRQMVDEQRTVAEERLGHSPDDLRRYWCSAHQHGLDNEKLFDVSFASEEFNNIRLIFLSGSTEQSAYRGMSTATWQGRSITRIQRVENGEQIEGSSKPYFDASQKSIEEQSLTFVPGMHTRWAFHGTDKIDETVNSTMAGFQPLKQGAVLGSVFGSGMYFARDAKFLVDANLCNAQPDGTRKLLLCLVTIGMPCAASPDQSGILPFRQKPHRYNSSVDSLSNPEVFITQHGSSAYPAYVITFQ